MATIIRKNEDLLAVHLSVERRRDGLQLKATLVRGEKRLRPPLSLPLKTLGYRARDQMVRAHQMSFPRPDLPPKLYALFFEASQQASFGEPVWLQIDYGSDVLGAYPWEAKVGPEIGCTLLRIPNFARNTYVRGSSKDPIVICAATPRAKGAPDWRHAVKKLLKGFADFSLKMPIVLYVGHSDHLDAGFFEEYQDDYPELDISLAPLPPSAEAPTRERFISERETLKNPWLQWISNDLGERFNGNAHAVHMACSGYSQNAQGALALPLSPTQDEDERWARFVGVPEFSHFADALNCQIAGLTALGDKRWREGLMLFANELSWKRPGVIVLDEGDGSASRVFDALLSGGSLYSSVVTNTVISAHPQALFEDASSTSVARSARLLQAKRGGFGNSFMFLEAVEGLETARTEETPLPGELMRMMDMLSSSRPKSALQAAQDQGTLNALEFLKNLPSEKGAR